MNLVRPLTLRTLHLIYVMPCTGAEPRPKTYYSQAGGEN